MWVEIIPGRHWDTWMSQWGTGTQINGCGVTYIGTMCGRRVARTYDGREWLEVST